MVANVGTWEIVEGATGAVGAGTSMVGALEVAKGITG